MLRGYLKVDEHKINLEGYFAWDCLNVWFLPETREQALFLDRGVCVDGEYEEPSWWGTGESALYASVNQSTIGVFQNVEVFDGVKYKSEINEELMVTFGSIVRECIEIGKKFCTRKTEGFLQDSNMFKIETTVGKINAVVKVVFGELKYLKLESGSDAVFEILIEETQSTFELKEMMAKSTLKKYKLMLDLFPEYHLSFEEDVWAGEVKTYTFDEIVARNPHKNYSWLKDQNYNIVNNLEDARKIIDSMLSHEGIVSFDTETSGLTFNVEKQDKLVGIVLSIEEGTSYYFPFRHKKFKNLCKESEIQEVVNTYFKELLETKDIACQNGSFDWKVMYSMGTCINLVEDTLILMKTTLWNDHRNMELSLKKLTNNFLNLDTLELSDFVDGRFGEGFKFWDMEEQDTKLYACPDADTVLRLLRLAKKEKLLEKYNAFSTYKCEVAFSIVIAYQEYYGHYVNLGRVSQLVKEINEKKAENYSKMVKIIGRDFNPNSSKQLAEILFKDLGYEILEYTESGNPSTAKSVRKKMMGMKNSDGSLKYPVVKYLNEYLEYATLEKNFTKKVDSLTTGSGLMYSKVEQFLETGRLSVSQPNYQSYDKIVKKYVEGRPGYYCLDADYSSVEYRILAGMAGQERLIERFFDPDVDYHRYQASRMFGIPYENVTPEQRSNAKGINFGLPYGMGNETLADTIFGDRSASSVAKAAKLRRKYFEGQEKIEQFFLKAREDGVRDGFSSTYFGRRRYFNKLQKSVSSIKREAGNNRIQGTAADIYKRAMVRLFYYLREHDLLGKVLMSAFVHDEVFLEVHKSLDPAKVLKFLSECMMLKIEGWCPLYIGAGFGRNWYEAKSGEIPIQAQEIIINKYGDTGLDWWDGDTDKLMEWEHAEIEDYQITRISDFLKNDENSNKVIPLAIDSLARDLMENEEGYDGSLHPIENMRFVAEKLNLLDEFEKRNFLEKVEIAEKEEEDEEEIVNPLDIAKKRVKELGVCSFTTDDGVIVIFRLDRDNPQLMKAIRNEIERNSGNTSVLAMDGEELKNTGLKVKVSSAYPAILRLYLKFGRR